MKELSEKLNECSLKATPQRLAIYAMLTSTDIHPSAETIYRSLQDTHPTMSLATVYRTLDTLRRAGLIQELNIGEGSLRYDGNSKPHAHLICTKCESVMDAQPLDTMDALKYELESRTGFSVHHEQLYFFGVCDKCQKNTQAL